MDRAALLTEILEELGSHNPAKAMRSMRHWPGGRLSLVHLNVLFILEADGPLPMRTLAEAMDVSQASATGIVDRMEQRGLVERRRGDEDRRVIRVAVTDEGLRLVAGMATERRDHMAQMLDELDDEELAAFLTGARAMRRARERLFQRLHAVVPPDAVPPDAAPPDPAPGTQLPAAAPSIAATPDTLEAPR